jgi:hypothetical protein
MVFWISYNLTVAKMRILKKNIFCNYVSIHYSGPAGWPQEAKVLLQREEKNHDVKHGGLIIYQVSTNFF